MNISSLVLVFLCAEEKDERESEKDGRFNAEKDRLQNPAPQLWQANRFDARGDSHVIGARFVEAAFPCAGL